VSPAIDREETSSPASVGPVTRTAGILAYKVRKCQGIEEIRESRGILLMVREK